MEKNQSKIGPHKEEIFLFSSHCWATLPADLPEEELVSKIAVFDREDVLTCLEGCRRVARIAGALRPGEFATDMSGVLVLRLVDRGVFPRNLVKRVTYELKCHQASLAVAQSAEEGAES